MRRHERCALLSLNAVLMPVFLILYRFKTGVIIIIAGKMPRRYSLYAFLSGAAAKNCRMSGARTDHMKTVLLIGVGRFGRHAAIQLSKLGHQVMAVDIDEERINEVMPYVTDAQIGNSTNEAFLRSLGVSNYDVCMVAISGDFQSSLETTSLLKELGAPCVIARAERDAQERFLLSNGADHVIYPEKEMAKWAAVRYTGSHILDYIELDERHAIFEVTVPESWIGRTVGALDIRKKHGVSILGVKRGTQTDFAVTPDTLLTGSVTLLVLGELGALRKCFKI